jgi:alpha-tubulin suppressor-like RCC1 family protein
VDGTTNQAVQWSATAGTITQQGLFTAPQTNGSVTIAATSVQNASAVGYATVQVGSVNITPGSISAGSFHTCGVTTTGQAYCWGFNEWGQLGDGTRSTSPSPTPTAVVGGLNFASISVGNLHTCGITTTGQAYCWGNGVGGRLGDGTTTDRRLTPTAVAGGLNFASISAGGAHTCGTTPTGQAYCWGTGAYGTLGNGTTADRLTPTAVGGGLTFAASPFAPGSVYAFGSTKLRMYPASASR